MRSKVYGLTREELERITLELLRNDPELKYDPRLHPEIVKAVQQQSGELCELLQHEIAAVEETWRVRRQLWSIAALALLATSLLFLTSTFWNPQILLGTRVANTTLSLSLVALTTLGVMMRWNAIRRQNQLVSLKLEAALQAPLRALIRSVFSQSQGEEARWSGTLSTSEAPALVELNIQDTISSRTYKRLRTFIRGHESSATGLAGARGSGKTTLMRQLRLDETLDCHVALVSAPVQYSAEEFTRLIHGELAQVGLQPGEANLIRNRMTGPALRVMLRILLMAAVTLLLIILWMFDKNRPSWNSLTVGWTGLALVSLGALIIGLLLNREWPFLRGRTRLMVSPQTTRELCLQQLEFLRWSTSFERSVGTAAKVSGTGFESARKLSRTEREVTHAESVQALRQFIDQLLALGDKPVIICVDELDKLADPADAVNAINGLKDLFHIAKAHFVLSVSTDAMHSFAARGVPVRDVFDSAFDTIIPVGPLSLEESQTLISRRARDFSQIFVLFCHAWSGGHARDLIRTARSCVDLKHELKPEEKPTIALLSQRVLRKDLREVVDATVEKLRGESDNAPETLDRVLAFQEMLEDESADLHELVESTAFPPITGVVAAELQPAAALACYARIAALCGRLFAAERHPTVWQSAAMAEAVSALGEARSSLGRHPREVERKLRRASDACAAVA